jgi:uncharacterized protein YutE (UPF0331/DUF86 family)
MDKEVINNKIESILVLLDKLKQILVEHKDNDELKEFLLYAAEKKAEEIIELATSINQELLSSKGRVGLSYYESFTELIVFNVFDKEELKQLASTAGFRNRLAHDYLEVDSEIALKSMRNVLKIYPTYLQKIKKIVSK